MNISKTGPVAAQSVFKTQIDENLRKAYQAVLTEEVPDRFRELLARLKAKEEVK